ncbi:MAG TPA: class I SAM-dependent methyltransferase [Solirubrobacteraceae bacterium]|nr:class I SAM-dependent methyltransferase [Solirubrobacteraceae bacterium]
MSDTLHSERVQRVLAELRRQADADDPPAKARVRAREQELGRRVHGRERAALYGPAASLAITSEVGELLYVLALARRARTIVEFGASLGFSTIHLAAAVRDHGAGAVISTEMEPDKARAAQHNLAAAGLADLVDLRVGDALETLAGVGDVDVLFLDGWNNLYLDVLHLVEPALTQGALVVADLSEHDPEQLPYLERVHDPNRGYVTVDVPLDAGVVVSVRTLPGQSIRSR